MLTNTPATIDKEGWLHKKGGRISNWKKRWIVVSQGVIKYYADEDKSKLKGSISLDDVSEVGKIAHDTRQNTFALKTSNRLYVFEAADQDDMNQWLKLFSNLQPKSMDPNSVVPQSTVGSVQKAILKVIGNIKSKFNKEDDPSDSEKSTDQRHASPVATRQTEIRSNSTDSPRSTKIQTINVTSPNRSTTIQTTANKQTVPNAYQEINGWTPMKKWEGTHEKPAWSYDFNETFPEELTTILEQLEQTSQKFNDEWTNLSEWSRKILTKESSNGLISENLKQGLARVELIWTSYEQIIQKCQQWNPESMISESINKMFITIKSLVEGKSVGWFIQLSSNIQEESSFELTYKRENTPTTEKPAYSYQVDPNSSPEVKASMTHLHKAANLFNNGWAIAIDASRKIGNASYAVVDTKNQIDEGMSIIQNAWKDYDIALNGLDKWNTNSLYTLEIKQHVAGLKRLTESKKKEWATLLDRYQQNLRNNQEFVKLFEPSDIKPAWYYIFSSSTPIEVSQGLNILQMASKHFNQYYASVRGWVDKIRPQNNINEVKRHILEDLGKIESTWKEFDEAIIALCTWNSTHEVIGEIRGLVSTLKELINSKTVDWMALLDDPLKNSNTKANDNMPSKPEQNHSSDPIDSVNHDATNNQTPISPKMIEPQNTTEEIKSDPTNTTLADDQELPLSNAKHLLEVVMKAITTAETFLDKPQETITNISGMGTGPFKVCHVYREAILMLRRAKCNLETSDDIYSQIEDVEKAISQSHVNLCSKWALHFLQNGDMSLAFEYYAALNEVLPEECQKLDEHFM